MDRVRIGEGNRLLVSRGAGVSGTRGPDYRERSRVPAGGDPRAAGAHNETLPVRSTAGRALYARCTCPGAVLFFPLASSIRARGPRGLAQKYTLRAPAANESPSGDARPSVENAGTPEGLGAPRDRQSG